MFITSVNDTSDKLFTGVNDNGDYSLSRIFSDKTVPPVPACRDLKIKKKQKFISKN
jgi:hypothetical protein